MKRLILLLLLFTTSVSVFSQIANQIQARRGVFTDQLYLNGRWVNNISTDMNGTDSTSDNVIATAKAVADYIRSKSMPTPGLEEVLSAGYTLTKPTAIYCTKDFHWFNSLTDAYYTFSADYETAEVGSRLQFMSGASAEFVLNPWVTTVRHAGLIAINGIELKNDQNIQLYSTCNFSDNTSSIIVDTGYLELSSGPTYAGGRDHRMTLFRDSIVIQGEINDGFGRVPITNLYVNGLPTSTSQTDSALVKLADGRLAYRASDVTASGWTNSESNIFNTNTGNVGIGLNNPTAKWHVRSLEFGTEGITGYINPIWNTTGNPVALKVNPQVISNGPGSLIADFQYSGLSRFSIRHDGLLTLPGYIGGQFTGTPAFDLQLNASGEVIKKVAPKIYTAIISQEGTNHPTVTVLENTIGNIVWQRQETGVYAANLSDAFPENKTLILVGSDNGYTGNAAFLSAFRDDSSTIILNGRANTQQSIDGLVGLSIEIRVYP